MTQNTARDYYTNLIFKDVEMDHIMKSIIHTNYWAIDRMVMKPVSAHFIMRFGHQDFQYELRYNPSKAKTAKPIVINDKLPQVNDDESDDSIIKFLTRIQKSVD